MRSYESSGYKKVIHVPCRDGTLEAALLVNGAAMGEGGSELVCWAFGQRTFPGGSKIMGKQRHTHTTNP